MKHALTTDRRTPDFVPSGPVQASPQFPDQYRQARRPFDYGVGYGNRSGYSARRSYSDVPGRGLFHCG